MLNEDKFISVGEEPSRAAAVRRCRRRCPQAGKALFISNGCDGCHTFKPAGRDRERSGRTSMISRRGRADSGQPLEQFIRQSIVDPNAYVAPGYPKGVMPEAPSAALPPAQLDALVKYLAEGSASERRRDRLPSRRGAGRAPPPAAAPTGFASPARAGLAAQCRGSMAALLRNRRRASSCSIRWLEGWHPIWNGSVITTVELTTVPLGFLAGLGGFDYWVRYASGAPTRAEDHSGHGARSWRDYFRINTDHKVIGIQYLVTTIVFFVIAGLLAMFMRAELAQPGMQFVDNADLQRALLGARGADDLPVRDPGLRRASATT